MKKAILSIIIFLASNTAVAERLFDSLQLDYKNCNLVQSGSPNEGIVFNGEYHGRFCFIVVPMTIFNRKYSFCALSGVQAYKGKVDCGFAYYDKDKTQISFTSGPDQLCEFMCVRR